MIRSEIKKIVKSIIEKAQKDGALPVFDMPEITVEAAAEKLHGDYSSNTAMKMAGLAKRPPMEIAQLLADNMATSQAAIFERVEAIMPGFINFCLSPEFLQAALGDIIKQGEKFGTTDFGRGQKVQVEFISANPTGPLTLGNGRGGFFGDCLANVLVAAGYEVGREYFINDAGYQVEILGHSYRKDEKAQYQGDYLNNPILQAKTEGLGILETGTVVANYILEQYIKPTVTDKMKIKFDQWISEKQLRDSGATDTVLRMLKDKNLTYEKDGAVWFNSTEFGDDKDRVLITSAKDGRVESATYLLPDAAYHYKKFVEDKFDKVIDVWGADHHGYAARLQAVGKALGAWDERKLKIIIMQLVRLFEGGREVRMSKRAGTYVTLDELLDEIPLDVARFFFLMRSPDTHMDFDLDLAREQSQKNPVYYVQYAFARISSILAKLKTQNSPASPELGRGRAKLKAKVQNLKPLTHQAELNLIKQLIRLPEIIEDTAGDYQVHRLPRYALDLVHAFHKFYEECRVLDEQNEKLTGARLALCEATKSVLKNIFNLMGISAPEKM